MGIIAPLLVGGLTPIIGSAAAEFVVPLLGGIAISALGLLFADKPPDPEEGRVPLQQDTPARGYGYGLFRRVGGVMLLENVSDGLTVVAEIVSHRIESVERFYLDDREVQVSGNVVGSLGDGMYGDGRAFFFWRLGADPETAYSASDHAVFGALSVAGIWTANHRGDGIASFANVFNAPDEEHFAKRFPNGKPTGSVVAKGFHVYDPRDEDQDPDDDLTWVWSGNLALQIMHLLCFNPFTAEYDYAKSILPVVELWKDQADICDEPVDLGLGGTEPRYWGGGFATTANDAKSTLARMLAACDGMLFKPGDGTLLLEVGKFQHETGIVITDDDILGYSLQGGPSADETVNTLYVRFSSPDHDYGLVDADPFEEDAFTAAASTLKPVTPDYSWVQSYTHARRLGKREVFRQNQQKRGHFDLKLSKINCCYKRWILIQSTLIPSLNGKYIENRKPSISVMSMSCRIEWSFAGNGTDIDVFDKTVDEGAPPPVPGRYNTAGPDPPANVNVAAEYFDLSDTTQGVRLIISFDEFATSKMGFSLHWRVKDTDPGTGGDQSGPWHTETYSAGELETDAGRTYIYTGPVTAATILEVEVQTISHHGSRSEFSPTETVNTATAAPSPPDNINSSLVGGNPRITWTQPNGTNTHHAYVYRVTTGGGFGSATKVSGAVLGTANQTLSFTDTTATAGTWDYYVTAANASDNESTEAGPTTITV